MGVRLSVRELLNTCKFLLSSFELRQNGSFLFRCYVGGRLLSI